MLISGSLSEKVFAGAYTKGRDKGYIALDWEGRPNAWCMDTTTGDLQGPCGSRERQQYLFCHCPSHTILGWRVIQEAGKYIIQVCFTHPDHALTRQEFFQDLLQPLKFPMA